MKHTNYLSLGMISAFGGIIGAFFGVLIFSTIGGNFGCPTWVNSLMNRQGYESCGNLGLIAGDVCGTMLAFLILWRARLSDQRLSFLSKIALIVLLVLLFAIALMLTVTNFSQGTWNPIVSLAASFLGLVWQSVLMAIPAFLISFILGTFETIKQKRKDELV